MSKKKVLVTGLNGVVGTALKSEFQKKYEFFIKLLSYE